MEEFSTVSREAKSNCVPVSESDCSNLVLTSKTIGYEEIDGLEIVRGTTSVQSIAWQGDQVRVHYPAGSSLLNVCFVLGFGQRFLVSL
jgi:hypothetical protein